MMDDLKSNKSTWLIVVLLSSPVIVSVMEITKEAIFGPKETQTTKLLQATLAELIAQRRSEKQAHAPQNVVYVPVPALAHGRNFPIHSPVCTPPNIRIVHAQRIEPYHTREPEEQTQLTKRLHDLLAHTHATPKQHLAKALGKSVEENNYENGQDEEPISANLT